MIRTKVRRLAADVAVRPDFYLDRLDALVVFYFLVCAALGDSEPPVLIALGLGALALMAMRGALSGRCDAAARLLSRQKTWRRKS
jgi:hypothetical protein